MPEKSAYEDILVKTVAQLILLHLKNNQKLCYPSVLSCTSLLINLSCPDFKYDKEII